jgi:hypothetical protein
VEQLSRTYRLWLTAAILLVLIMLTAVIVIIIIANARQEDQELAFSVTLTEVWTDVNATQTAFAVTLTPAPTVLPGMYAFALAPDGPVYAAAEECDTQRLTGQVLGLDGEPVDGFTVYIWGDYFPLTRVLTGPAAGQVSGRWVLPLVPANNRRLWVQLGTTNRYVSPPVEVVFTAAECDRGQVEVMFLQNTPLD